MNKAPRTYGLRFLLVLGILWSFSFLFKNYVISFLLSIGSQVDFDSIAFFVGFLLLALTVLFVFIRACHKRYIPHKNSTLLIALTVLFYSYLRFDFSDNLEFISIYGNIKFADLIFILGLIFLINLILAYRRIKSKDENESFFLQDSLFTSGELVNEKILQKLIDTLIGFKPEVAFSIGVNAVWGYGKSSFLEKLKTDYENADSTAIVFWYRVWKNKGVNAIIENFFTELSTFLKQFSGEIDSEFQGYVDAILQLPSTELSKLITAGREAINGKESLEQHFNSINRTIQRIDRQIIILLDDLDRLEKDEILHTLKLIRTLSDFNNVIFIVGYDREYVVKTIERAKGNFLDKVFNMEINLLPFDENLITQSLFKEIDKLYPSEKAEVDIQDFNSAFKSLFDVGFKPFIIDIPIEALKKEPCTKYELNYLDFIGTFRDVKRFLNEFRFNESFLTTKDDVIASEYILLRLLTYKYRYIQNLVLNKLDSFLTPGKIDWENKKIQKGSMISPDVWIYDEESKKKIEKELDEINCINDFKVVNASLCRLFGENTLEYYRNNQTTISKSYYTNLYLRNDIASGNIAISQIQKSFEKAKLNLLVDEIGKDPEKREFSIQNELKYFIFRNEIKIIEQFQDVVLSLQMFMSEGLHNDDEKVLEILKNGLGKFYKNNRKGFLEMIEQVLLTTNKGYLDNLFADIILNEKRKEQKEQYGISGIVEYKNNFFKNGELKKLLISKLKSIIEKTTNLNEVIEYYHLLVEKLTADKNIIKPYRVNQILQKDIEEKFSKYYETYLFSMISDKADSNEAEFRGYQPNDFLAQIFGSQEAYEILLKDLNSTAALSQYQQNGVKNLLLFLKKLKIEEELKKRVELTIQTIEKYIEKGYKPLTKKEYNEIWKDLKK